MPLDANAKIAPVALYFDGWIPLNETWTYASVDDPTGVISWTDADTKVSPGMRIRFDNGGNTIYGIVTAVTSSTMTFLHEMNNNVALHLMANSAITNPCVSTQKAPLGFPLSPERWSVEYKETGLNTRQINSPTNDAWYNIAGIHLVVPIGVWDLSYNTQISAIGNNTMFLFSTLSTSSTSETDLEFSSVTISSRCNHRNSKIITKITKQTHYLLSRVYTSGSLTLLDTNTTQGGLRIKATCSYL